MPTLALVRHAKSDWGAPELDDHDRPLNDRGRRDAPVVAARLAETGFVPDRILVSTALRAQQTAAFFGAEFGVTPEPDKGLYGAPARAILAAAAASGAASVMVVAHDPGMSTAAAELSDGEFSHMPTCAVAVFGWKAELWDAALASPPATRTFLTPRP